MRRRIFDIIEKADSDDMFSRWYDRFMIVCIFMSLIPRCFHHTNFVFMGMDAFTAVVFIIDYGLRWWTADFKLHEGKRSRPTG